MTEENAEMLADAKLREYGLMFSKLMESPRFRELMSLHFTFQKEVDEESKQIDFTVVENPPEVIAAKMKAQMGEAPQIQVVSGGAAQAVLAKAKRSLGKKTR